eukprot:2828523-Rhodomonas_salina.2
MHYGTFELERTTDANTSMQRGRGCSRIAKFRCRACGSAYAVCEHNRPTYSCLNCGRSSICGNK